MFGDPIGNGIGDGDDFDLSKLQALLRKNSMEIDNILRGSDVSEKLIDKSARSLSFSDLTTPRAQKEDLTVSYESKPNGGFSVFYTVPKQNAEQQQVEKIKDLIQKVNAETLLSDNLLNSLEDEYYDDEDEEYYDEEEYYDDDEDEYYYDNEDDDYLAEDSLQSIRTLRKPPSTEDDYYDPGPPASFYDNAADYIDGEEDFDYIDDNEYDYEDDYYYDTDEDKMMIQSSTLSPALLSPTIQKLTALTLKSLNAGKKNRKRKKKRKTRKSIDRSFDVSGKNNRTKRSPLYDTNDSNNVVSSVENVNALDLNTPQLNHLNPDPSNLDPKLYDVKINKDMLDPVAESSSKHISYPYSYYEEDEHDDEIWYDDLYLDEDEFLHPFPPTKNPPWFREPGLTMS